MKLRGITPSCNDWHRFASPVANFLQSDFLQRLMSQQLSHLHLENQVEYVPLKPEYVRAIWTVIRYK